MPYLSPVSSPQIKTAAMSPTHSPTDSISGRLGSDASLSSIINSFDDETTPSSSSSSSRTPSEDDSVISSPPTPLYNVRDAYAGAKDGSDDASKRPSYFGMASATSVSDAVAHVKSNATTSQRPFRRNHIRSQSHDAIADMSTRPGFNSERRSSYGSDLDVQDDASPTTGFIYLHPASPGIEEEEISISTPRVVETSPRTKRLSLFTFGEASSTIWPEGEANENESVESSPPSCEEQLPWVPAEHRIEHQEPPSPLSVTFPVASGVPTTAGPSSPPLGSNIPTPKASQVNAPAEEPIASSRSTQHLGYGHGPRSRSSPGLSAHLRISMDKLGRESGPATPMVRKKSGELVRSSLKHRDVQPPNTPANIRMPPASTSSSGTRAFRAKSAPTTPTGPKNVHFDKQLEHVKLFLAQQRPAAVSRSGSPGETTEEESEAFPFPAMSMNDKVTLLMPNFHKPTSDDGRDVYLQSLELQQDTKTLRGSIFIRNISFHKRVVVRFTLDDWQTVSEVTAEYSQPISGGYADQWTFGIKLQDMLARIEEKKMFMALRYTVDGRDIWDNNSDQNYIIQFKREVAPPPQRSTVSASKQPSQYQWSVTNAGQASERMSELRRELDRLVSDDRNDLPLAAGGRGFSHRYDFGAALRQQPGRKSEPVGASSTNLFFNRQSGAAVPSNETRSPFPTPTGLPASASGYSRSEHNGVYSTDYAMPQHHFAPSFYAGEPFGQVQRPPSPPHDADPGERRQNRFHTYPANRGGPQDHARALTPRMFEKSSVSDFFAPLPMHGTSRRPRSPPPERSSADSSLVSTASNSAESSPPRSGSPVHAGYTTRSPMYGEASFDNGETPTYSNFLERFCFFQPGQQGSALGLVNGSAPDASPLDVTTPRACSSYMQSPYSSSQSSGSNTPAGGDSAYDYSMSARFGNSTPEFVS